MQRVTGFDPQTPSELFVSVCRDHRQFWMRRSRLLAGNFSVFCSLPLEIARGSSGTEDRVVIIKWNLVISFATPCSD